MKRFVRSLMTATFAVVAFGSLAGLAGAQTVIYYPAAPPAPVTETMPEPPSPSGYTWIGGYYRYDEAAQAYVWVPGHYIQTPTNYTTWVPGHWRQGRDGWYWVPGHWSKS